MEQYGDLLGLLLLVAVSAAAALLAWKAEAGIDRFREEHHEQFQSRGPK